MVVHRNNKGRRAHHNSQDVARLLEESQKRLDRAGFLIVTMIVRRVTKLRDLRAARQELQAAQDVLTSLLSGLEERW